MLGRHLTAYSATVFPQPPHVFTIALQTLSPFEETFPIIEHMHGWQELLTNPNIHSVHTIPGGNNKSEGAQIAAAAAIFASHRNEQELNFAIFVEIQVLQSLIAGQSDSFSSRSHSITGLQYEEQSSLCIWRTAL